MTDSPLEPKDEEDVGDDSKGAPQGPAQWVPKGALSAFMLQGAAIAFAAQILALVGGFASQVFLARLLTPAGLGVYFLTQSLVIMTANVGAFGVNRPISRMISTDLGSGHVGAAMRSLRSVVGIVSVSGFVVITLFLSGVGKWIALHIFDSPMMAATTVLVSLWIAGRIVLDVGASVLQGLHRVGMSALLSGAFPPTTVAVVCGILLWAGIEVEYQSIILLASVATAASGLLCVAFVWSPFVGIRGDGPPRTRTLLASTIPIFGAGMLQVAAVQADLWIVGAQLDVSDVAFYGAAKRLTPLVGFSLSVLAFVVPPLIADLYARGERERLQRLVRAATTAASLPAAAAFGLFMVFGSEILTLAYGEVYADAVTILRILCAEKLVFMLMGPGSLLLVMTGHERVVFRITMVSATVSLGAIYVGGLLGGLLGIAIGFSLSSFGTGLWYFIEAHRQTGIWVHVNPLAIRPMVEIVQRVIHKGS